MIELLFILYPHFPWKSLLFQCYPIQCLLLFSLFWPTSRKVFLKCAIVFIYNYLAFKTVIDSPICCMVKHQLMLCNLLLAFQDDTPYLYRLLRHNELTDWQISAKNQSSNVSLIEHMVYGTIGCFEIYININM